MRSVLYTALFFAVGFAAPLYASTSDELAQTQKAIEETKAEQQALQEKNKALEGELKRIQQKLVELADAIQDSEADLSSSEEKLRILDDQLAQRRAALLRHRKQLAALVQAALHMSQTPPEAVIMMPGDSLQNMKIAGALKMTSASIKQETDAVRHEMEALQQLKDKVTAKQKEISRKQAALNKERDGLAQKLTTRQQMQSKLAQKQQEENDRLNQLAKKAEDLQSLMSSIAREEKDRMHQREAMERLPGNRVTSGSKGHLRSFADAEGAIRSPVAGAISRHFGTPFGHNETSKGVTILSREGAQVTAPYDAEVVFAGTFLDYGQMVILRHSDDFHTLLAGLAQIDVQTGQFLLEGEPIGAMGSKDSGNRLYVELRKNNQPIDPAPWIRGFNKKKLGDN